MFKIFFKGYELECQEAVIIKEFIQEVFIQLESLKRAIDEIYRQTFTVAVIDGCAYSKTIEQLVQNIEDIKNLIIHNKMKECQETQSLIHYEYRTIQNINNLQIAFGQFFDQIKILRSIIDKIIHSDYGNDKFLFLNYEEALKAINGQLISSSFIIEEQPPQVMKTNTNFTAKIRWLLGDKYQNDIIQTHIGCYILSGNLEYIWLIQCRIVKEIYHLHNLTLLLIKLR